jgi:alpha-mannosidase
MIAVLTGATLTGMCGVFAYDLTQEQIVYAVPMAHLDTQWQNTLDVTVRQLIPNTLHMNFNYFRQYPEYKFSFEGAYRYWLAKINGGAIPTAGYNAHDWDTLKSYVGKGRWIPNGGTWNANDVLIPSAESLVRQTLYCQQFFMDEFDKKSNDMFLTDCFGFSYALPTIAAHCGLKGFSTAKLWAGQDMVPFALGKWIGPDGGSLVAITNSGNYFQSGLDIRTADGDWLRNATQSFTNGPGGKPGIWATYDFVNDGDQGGGPTAANVSSMINRIRANASNAIKVYDAGSGQFFDDLTPPMLAALPSYDGELLKVTHGIGCYTAWAPMKLKNRRNEQRAALTEFACVTANSLTGGTFSYPADTIKHAWWLTLAQQFHDVLTGTSNLDVYSKYAMPAEDTAYNAFNYALGLANNAMANSDGQQLTTTATANDGRIPVVIVNELATPRTDVVDATVNFGGATVPTGVKVYNASGAEVPSSIVSKNGQSVSIDFIATVQPASYSVYEVQPTNAANPPDANLTVNAAARTLENAYYKVTINAAGDISSIVAKQVKGGTELLSGASCFEIRPDASTSWPAWEIGWANVSATPTNVTGTPTITVEENSSVRVGLRVTRSQGSSQFTQIIRLAAGEAGKQVGVNNEVNWLTDGKLLKMGFPVSSANPNATWDVGVGTISRANMSSKLFEVPGQQWADMTATDGSYGVSILSTCKYGWNKESNNKINLTLLHSPSPTGFSYTNDLSSVPIVGIHKYSYWFYGHSGNWANGTVKAARCANQPLYAFQATPRAGARTARVFSFVTTDTPQVDVMAVKKAEKSNNYIVRVRETMGGSMANAHLTFAQNIQSFTEMSGAEDTVTPASPASINGNALTFALTKYKLRTFSVALAPLPTNNAPGNGGAIAPRPEWMPVTVRLAGIRNSKAVFNVRIGEIVRGISIFDAKGRLVRNLVSNGGPGNARTIVWDCRNAAWKKVPIGMYYINCKSDHRGYSSQVAVYQ